MNSWRFLSQLYMDDIRTSVSRFTTVEQPKNLENTHVLNWTNPTKEEIYTDIGRCNNAKRKTCSRGTKQRKKEFDSKLSAYSLTALNNVIEIAEKAFNTETRLRANTYILDHAYGKDYTVFKQEQEQSDTEMKIKLNIVNNTSDSESWNDDTSELDNWGEDDIYK